MIKKAYAMWATCNYKDRNSKSGFGCSFHSETGDNFTLTINYFSLPAYPLQTVGILHHILIFYTSTQIMGR